MKIVVDTNILFSFFWEGSFTKKLLKSGKFNLISPKFSLKEIEKYSADIIKKARINHVKFKKYLDDLKKFVIFIDKKNYSDFLKDGAKISPDKADSHFFALCLKNSCPLWSKDSLLKKQDKIKVLSTEEIIESLFS